MIRTADYDSGVNADSPEVSLNDVLSDSASIISIHGDISRTLQALRCGEFALGCNGTSAT